MANAIELYIGDYRADIEEDALILMNYASEDLQDPTIVKNSYSQTIVLQGNEQNDKIFGNFFKLSRDTNESFSSLTGSSFNPLRKLPFQIFSKTGEILESGYCKLNEVSYSNRLHSYKVTLYGGIGEYLYNLMYDVEGEKKTLASLNFLNSVDPDNELDFTINRDTILSAWDRLYNLSIIDQWSVINFAPCNNGLYDGFDSNKAFTRNPITYALPSSLEDNEGEEVTPEDGILIEYQEDFSEWEMRELRSYHQRPIISVKAIIDAVCNSINNGGYSVYLDESFFNELNPYYANSWMTLPKLTEIETSDLNQIDGYSGVNPPIDQPLISEVVVWSGDAIGDMKGVIEIELGGRISTTKDIWSCYEDPYNGLMESPINVCFVGYDSNDTPIVASPIQAFIPGKYVIEGNMQTDEDIIENFPASIRNMLSTVVRNPGNFSYSPSYGVPMWSAGKITIGFEGWHNIASIKAFLYSNMKTSIVNTYLFGAYQAIEANFSSFMMRFHYMIDQNVTRVSTGSTFSKAQILGNTISPAEFLLSYIKTFNLKLFTDNKEKTVHIVTDENYLNGRYLDFSDRIDQESKTSIPLYGDTAKLLMASDMVEGRSAENYKNKYGKTYGDFLIHTGYEFNNEEKDMMSAVLFRSAIDSTSMGKFFRYEAITRENSSGSVSTAFFPKAILSPCKVTCVDGDLKAEGEVSAGEVNNFSNFNSKAGYDQLALVEFCDSERKSLDGAGVMVFHAGDKIFSGVEGFRLSDDNARSLTLNDGVPCWDLDAAYTPNLPLFLRHMGGSYVNALWDYGLPREFYDVSIEGYSEAAGIYTSYWSQYIRELYDKNVRRLKVKVNMEGIDVSQDLLRRPVYYDSCWWYISEIRNHALAKSELTEMTLVKMINFQYSIINEE